AVRSLCLSLPLGPAGPPLFPYTTLFRSGGAVGVDGDRRVRLSLIADLGAFVDAGTDPVVAVAGEDDGCALLLQAVADEEGQLPRELVLVVAVLGPGAHRVALLGAGACGNGAADLAGRVSVAAVVARVDDDYGAVEGQRRSRRRRCGRVARSGHVVRPGQRKRGGLCHGW